MHEAAFKACAEMAREIGDISGLGLDIGGMDYNGSVRDCWPKIAWTVVDPKVEEKMGAKHTTVQNVRYISADAAHYSSTVDYDIIICTEVFEHTPNWLDLVANAYKMLKPGGHFIVTCAATGREPHSYTGDGYPEMGEWYKNINPVNLGDALYVHGFQCLIQYNPATSDIYAYGIK